VLPSAQEGLPRCALEALCLELPVIGSDIRGTRDLLQSGAGILFPVGDVTGLCHAMRQIIGNPAATVEMRRIGRQEVPKYSLTQIIEMHTQLYSEALCTSAF
jgi:glycosyltransferase involved in cell wall biosynthesis